MADAVLRLDHICKSYNIGTPVQFDALHDVSLTLENGEFCALMGPSGSGKSTLLNIIGLLDRPTRGTLLIDGLDTAKMSDGELTQLRGRKIGFVFQHHYLISAFTAVENVMMPRIVAEGKQSAEMKVRARALLERMDLLRWENHRPQNMSGGQQQRVAIARALMMKPALILADEPTGNLDTKSADAVLETMRKENKGRETSFLIVTHNMELAARCDRIIELIDGKVSAGSSRSLPGPRQVALVPAT